MTQQPETALSRLLKATKSTGRVFMNTWKLLPLSGKGLFIAHAVIFMMAIGLDMMLPFLLAWMIEAAQHDNPDIWLYLILLALGWFGTRLLDEIKVTLYVVFEQMFQREFYRTIFDRFTLLPFEYIERIPATEHSIVADRGAAGIRGVLYDSLFNFIPLAVRIVFLLIVLALQVDYWVSAVLGGAILAMIALTMGIGAVLNDRQVTFLETWRDLFTMITESVSNAITIRTFSAHKWAKTRLDSKLKTFVKQVYRVIPPILALGLVQGLLLGGMFLTVNAAIILSFEGSREIVPLLVIANGLAIQLAQPLIGFQNVFRNWLQGVSSIILVLDLLEQDNTRPLIKHSTHDENTIALQNVTARYDNNAAILDYSAVIPIDGVTGITGPSGSGKSTLAKALAGLKQYDGKILLPKSNMVIRYISQNPELFNESLHVNLGLSKSPRKSGLFNSSLKLAQLPKSEYGKFPKKLGEGGNKISPGQQSRVALARALFSDCDILILDEPTASLDEENKNRIFDILFELNRLRKIKIILVTHDQTAIKRCDHVLRLKHT